MYMNACQHTIDLFIGKEVKRAPESALKVRTSPFRMSSVPAAEMGLRLRRREWVRLGISRWDQRQVFLHAGYSASNDLCASQAGCIFLVKAMTGL